MTESTGWDSQPDPAQAPPAQPLFTDEQLAQAAQQIQAQHVGVTGPQVGSPMDLGLAAVAAGAEATDVDVAEMLASIRAMQARITALEAEKRAANAPAVVTYAQALLDHLVTKSAQHPLIQADPDHTYGQPPRGDRPGAGVLGAASRLVDTAVSAADAGHPGTFGKDLDVIRGWVTRHARRFPAVDYGYVLELAEEAALAATKLAA